MIRRVDTENERIRHVLNMMDEHCFPMDELASKAGWWWIAWWAGEPAGFAGLRALAVEQHIGYLCRAGVLEHCRGHGLQKKLIRARIAYARRLGLRELVTDTTANIPSANSLISCGFKLYTPVTKWAFDSSLYWRKSL